MRADGSVACWGYDGALYSTPPGATWGQATSAPADVRTESIVSQFASVSTGWAHTCGVRADGSVACWEDDGSPYSTPPVGEFASVSGGGGVTPAD